MGLKAMLGALAAAGLVAAVMPAEAQQTQSRLYEVTKGKKLRVCQFPLYYSISFRNPEIGMFGVGATLKRAQAVEFSRPYLLTNIYAVTRKDSKVKKWEDVDQKGIKAAVSL